MDINALKTQIEGTPDWLNDAVIGEHKVLAAKLNAHATGGPAVWLTNISREQVLNVLAPCIMELDDIHLQRLQTLLIPTHLDASQPDLRTRMIAIIDTMVDSTAV